MQKVLVLYSDRRFTPWRENIDSSVLWRTIKAIEHEASVSVAHFTRGKDFGSFVRSFDMVFNLCYGYKTLSQIDVVKYLEQHGARHTSSNYASQSAANDKLRYPEICARLDVRTPRIYSMRNLDNYSLNGDLLIVKPRRGACHRDIAIGKLNELRPILSTDVSDTFIQDYIPGREFSVAVIPNSDGNGYEILPPVEIRSKNKIYIAGNHIGKSSKTFTPSIDPALYEALSDTSLKVHTGFGLNGYSRIDYRLSEDGELFMLDVNPMPNLHPKHSFLPNMSRKANIKFEALVMRIFRWFDGYYRLSDNSGTCKTIAFF